MSNTSSVTPYRNSGSRSTLGSSAGTAAAACAGVAVGAVGLALAGSAVGIYGLYRLGRWLAVGSQPGQQEWAEIRKVVQQYEDQMVPPDLSAVTSLDLQLKNDDLLVHSAKMLNYRVIDDAGQRSGETGAPILLERDSGERLAITRDKEGRLSIHTAGDQGLLHSLVSRHTQDRVQEYLSAKGMRFEAARLSNGEMQFLARESEKALPGGAAEIKAHVHADGTVLVDIDKCRGRRCEEIVQQIAEAVDGTVSGMTKKTAWFQLPGEPAKTKVQA